MKKIHSQKKFAFLVHPRELEDFFIRFPYLRWLPRRIVEWITKHHGPVIGSKITGLVSKEGEQMEGYVIGVTMTAHQMMEDREYAKKKIYEAVEFARDKGASVIGLGALTASLTRGGLDVADIEGIGVTTGRAMTVKTIVGHAFSIMDRVNLEPSNVTAGIVGAAGSIGSSSMYELMKGGVNKFVLVDLERKLEDAKEKAQTFAANHPDRDIEIVITHQVADIQQCDLIVAATSAPEVVIGPDDLKLGAIVINDAQPSDISPEVLKQRDDVLVIEGGIIYSETIRANFNFRLASRADTFSCLGETLILAHNGWSENFAIGELDHSLIEKIDEMGRTTDIVLAKPQNNNGYITDEQVENVKRIISQRTVE